MKAEIQVCSVMEEYERSRYGGVGERALTHGKWNSLSHSFNLEESLE